jgi:hypothetical protein
VAGPVLEHPDSDSDTESTVSTDQQVDLTRIERLGSGVDTNAFRTSGLDDENLSGSDIGRTRSENEIVTQESLKFEGCGAVRL